MSGYPGYQTSYGAPPPGAFPSSQGYYPYDSSQLFVSCVPGPMPLAWSDAALSYTNSPLTTACACAPVLRNRITTATPLRPSLAMAISPRLSPMVSTVGYVRLTLTPASQNPPPSHQAAPHRITSPTPWLTLLVFHSPHRSSSTATTRRPRASTADQVRAAPLRPRVLGPVLWDLLPLLTESSPRRRTAPEFELRPCSSPTTSHPTAFRYRRPHQLCVPVLAVQRPPEGPARRH